MMIEENNEFVAYSVGVKLCYDSNYHNEHKFPRINMFMERWSDKDASESVNSRPDAFLRGVLEANGFVTNRGNVEIDLPWSVSVVNRDFILSKIPNHVKYSIKGPDYRQHLVIEGVNAFDFLAYVYDHKGLFAKSVYRDDSNPMFKQYLKSVVNVGDVSKTPLIKYTKLRDDAVAPMKSRPSDSGYDLTLIDIAKTVAIPAGDKVVTYYDTGISVEPPAGFYFDLVPRSSLSKTGYMLANSIGVIDQSYRGSILVPLIRVEPRMPDIALPFRGVQIIPRPVHHFPLQEVEQLSETDRGEGGFGSTGA